MHRDMNRQTSEHHRNHLESRYLSLKEQIAALSRRRSLSSEEQMMVSSMKRQKLAMKDELARLG